MAAILLGLAWLDPFDTDPEAQPPDRVLKPKKALGEAKGIPLSVRIVSGSDDPGCSSQLEQVEVLCRRHSSRRADEARLAHRLQQGVIWDRVCEEPMSAAVTEATDHDATCRPAVASVHHRVGLDCANARGFFIELWCRQAVDPDL
jgi:hypothetical protein